MKKVARHKLVISRQSCNHFDTNVRHWSEQANWNVAQINEWWFTQLISAPDAIVKNLSAGRKYSWCIVRCHGRVEANALRHHLRQHHHVGQSHLSIPRHLSQLLNWSLPNVHRRHSFQHLKALMCLYAFGESVDCHLLSSFCDDSNLHISLFKYVLSTMGVSKESISKFLIGIDFT